MTEVRYAAQAGLLTRIIMSTWCRKLAVLLLEVINRAGQEATPANHHDSIQASNVGGFSSLLRIDC